MPIIRRLAASAMLVVLGLAQDGSAGERAAPGTATVTSAIPWPVAARADCATPRQ